MSQDDSPEFQWLFSEDAGEELYSAELLEHRAACAHWLAHMHTSAGRLKEASRLPGRGPGYYLEHLRAGRGNIVRHLDNPVLDAADVGVLEEVLARCDFMESRWDQI